MTNYKNNQSSSSVPCVRIRLFKYVSPLFSYSWLADNFSMVLILVKLVHKVHKLMCYSFRWNLFVPCPAQYPWTSHLKRKYCSIHWNSNSIRLHCSSDQRMKSSSLFYTTIYLKFNFHDNLPGYHEKPIFSYQDSHLDLTLRSVESKYWYLEYCQTMKHVHTTKDFASLNSFLLSTGSHNSDILLYWPRLIYLFSNVTKIILNPTWFCSYYNFLMNS